LFSDVCARIESIFAEFGIGVDVRPVVSKSTPVNFDAKRETGQGFHHVFRMEHEAGIYGIIAQSPALCILISGSCYLGRR